MRRKRKIQVRLAHQNKKKKADLEKIKAGGGVVWRRQGVDLQVLLIYRNGVWDLPKGKLEDEESLQDCAVREVAEEIGSQQFPKAEESLGITIHHYKENNSMIEKETHWWKMSLNNDDTDFKPQTEEGIKSVKWTEISEAVDKVGYENLRVVLKRLRNTNL